MADTGRRRMGPAATGSGIPPSGARSPSRYLAQTSPQQQQQQQQQQPLQRPYTRGGPLPRGGGPAPRTPPVNSNSKMGIKSGMTVEDLKRLTQQRMQQSTQAPTPPAVSQAADPRPATPTAASTPSTSATSSSATPTPTLNMAAVHAPQQPPTGGPVQSVPTPTPLVPKAGMSVQELKQLTSLRLASQNVPLHQSEITGLVSKAVLSNAAKSHYRESLRSSLTPSTTPRHTVMGGTTPSHRGRTHASSLDEYDPMAGRHSLPSRPMGMPSMRHGGGMSHDAEFMRSSDFGQSHNHHPSVNHMRYSYSGPDDFFDDSDSEVEADFMRPSLDLDEEGKFTTNDFHKLAFREDSFPPPPPLADDSSGRGGFVATSLPSWSPPPARAKKLEQPSHPVSFYSQQSSFFSQQQTKDDSNRDQNAIIAPPPGLSRRPSMTVPWQVAEAVLNTPQTTTGRKTVMLSPTNSGDGREPVTSNMFANPMKTTDRRNDHGLKSGAAEVAAEFGMLALSRQRSANGAPPPIPPNSSTPPPGPPPMLNASPPGSGAGPRRGSFGNAAEFFKFRRRSKSRLELARDVAASNAYMESGQFANYGATSAGPGSNGGGSMMPGIDETADMQENFSVVANDTSDDEDYTNAVSEGEASFVSFYNAAGVGKTRDGLSSLSIPPPPPPPLTDDEDDGASTTSSSRGLPMMSPNGVRLRKVAELARRGSLSNEDKTRVKDEIIQSSLGIGASNAARILTAKPSPNGAAAAAAAGERPGTTAPPPGFQRLGATPPRDTPKATAKKTISSGIVRNVSTGIAARSPPKSSGVLMLSPTTASRKALTPTPTAGTLEERLAAAAQRVADCVTKGDMVAFQEAMSELDKIRNEASEKMMRG